MRCPHCASPSVAPPVCAACGRPLQAWSEPPSVPGLEPTAAALPELAVELMPGLELTEKPLADVAVSPVPGLEPTAAALPELAVEPMPGLEPTELPPADVFVSPMPGLEPTRSDAAPEVAVERMPELITNAEALGSDYRIEAAPLPGACPRCRRPLRGARACPGCGHVIEARRGPAESEARCAQCGVPNPPGRERCAGCGAQL